MTVANIMVKDKQSLKCHHRFFFSASCKVSNWNFTIGIKHKANTINEGQCKCKFNPNDENPLKKCNRPSWQKGLFCYHAAQTHLLSNYRQPGNTIMSVLLSAKGHTSLMRYTGSKMYLFLRHMLAWRCVFIHESMPTPRGYKLSADSDQDHFQISLCYLPFSCYVMKLKREQANFPLLQIQSQLFCSVLPLRGVRFRRSRKASPDCRASIRLSITPVSSPSVGQHTISKKANTALYLGWVCTYKKYLCFLNFCEVEWKR